MAQEHPSEKVQEAITKVENEILSLKWDLVKSTLEYADMCAPNTVYCDTIQYIETLETVKGMMADI